MEQIKKLTIRQKEIFDFVSSYIEKKHYSPAIRDIAAHFEISPKAAFDHVKALENKGYVRSDSLKSRTLEIVRPEQPEPEQNGLLKIPFLGQVAAGTPIFAEENFDGFIEISEKTLTTLNTQMFALKVKGDSMIDAGILDGDVAIIAVASTAENGEIVVARLNEEAVTIKRFFRENNRIRLQPENKGYSPVFSQNVTILGKLKMVIRKY